MLAKVIGTYKGNCAVEIVKNENLLTSFRLLQLRFYQGLVDTGELPLMIGIRDIKR